MKSFPKDKVAFWKRLIAWALYPASRDWRRCADCDRVPTEVLAEEKDVTRVHKWYRRQVFSEGGVCTGYSPMQCLRGWITIPTSSSSTTYKKDNCGMTITAIRHSK